MPYRSESRLALEVARNLGLVGVASGTGCVRAAIVVQVCLADTIRCQRGLISENSQLAMEPERADLGSVLKADTPGTKGLVANGYSKFTGLVLGSPHDKAILAHERFGFETNVLNLYIFSHAIPFVPAGETFYGIATLVTL
jgi:hypothetical protein